MDPAAYLLVNFGGPRNIGEVYPFLQALLTDQEVIRTRLPRWVHHWMFSKIAKKRSLRISKDYQSIGGKSPLYEDTEWLRHTLSARWETPVWAFHRYLPSTHAELFHQLERVRCHEIRCIPLFPQFSYATSGSAASYFSSHLATSTLLRLRWLKSYPTDPLYLGVWERLLRDCMKTHCIAEEELFLLCSAHGLPVQFIQSGDPYHAECTATYRGLLGRFPKSTGLLSFQSQLGPQEWTRPYTKDIVVKLKELIPSYMKVVVVPLSFTSDHLETLFEIEQEYLPILKQHFEAYRLPAMNRHPDWVETLCQLGKTSDFVHHAMMMRHPTAYRGRRSDSIKI